ncbi:hypothetical protein HF521_014940 [Silurus meridionalis]|uniref:Ig-like domain-containing protein n=1 Tax=Silurus meridionalis TaxID=175797 RepID=A0A8T0A9R1_SILME|nr:hypothetical protein HF521_014940 [Silurus meridionalis]
MEGHHDDFNNIFTKIKSLFNDSRGHTLQRMYGCESDDGGITRRYDQYCFDGEDFISLDLENGTWIAVKPQALILKHDWESNKYTKFWKNFLEHDCIDLLKTFVNYGRETLKRKVRPETFLFQKESPPEVVCDATGFFPKALNISWKKDGQDVHVDVDLRETLPNQDGSFQKRSILKVSAEELQKHTYTCVIEHSSLEKDLVLPVSERRILRDGGSGGGLMGIIVGVVVALVVLVAVVAGIVVWKKKNSGFKSVPSRASSEGDSSSNNEDPVMINRCRTNWYHLSSLVGFAAIWKKRNSVRPETSLFQKEASPEVVCDATGFCPKALNISWQKDGEDVHVNVELRETLPNQDGSFQKRCILNVSAEELQKHTYTCVIEHSSLEKDLVLPVSERRILRDGGSDGGSDGGLIGIIIGVVVALVVLVAVVAGIVIWKKKNSEAHSLQYHYTALTPRHAGSEFTAVGLLDEKQYMSYSSSHRRLIPDNWIKNIMSENYWKDEAQNMQSNQYRFNSTFKTVREQFNHSRDPPETSLFQEEASSPEVVCHATGFFPKALNISWQKDGEDVHKDVDLRETLPNQDGSFQKRSILKVSAEELQKHTYTCVIEHSSLEKDLVLPVSERRILRDGGSGGGLIGIIVGVIVALVVLVAVVAGIVIWKKKNSGFKPVHPNPVI